MPPGAIRKRRDSVKTCATHVSEEDDLPAITVEMTDPVELIALARDNPVLVADEAQAAMTTLLKVSEEQKIGLIGAAYAAAYHMIRTDGAWEKFLKSPRWNGLSRRPKNTIRHKNRALHHMMRFLFRAEDKNAQARARVYANMLIDRFNASFKPEGVIPLIERWGIENLRKAGEAKRRAERQGDRDPFFDDLNEIDDDLPQSMPPPTIRRWRKLTTTEIKEYTALIDDFHAQMCSLLEREGEADKPSRPRTPTNAGHERLADQPRGSMWHQYRAGRDQQS